METKQIITKSCAELMAQKLKDIENRKSESARSLSIGRANFLGKVGVCVLIALTIIATYIYIERQAQAALGEQNQSRLMMVYDFYTESISGNKKKLISDMLFIKGVEENLSQQIAEAVVDESEKTDIPIQMYLAIMKTESTFRPTAVSQAYAKGIMQIQPGTWDAYVAKHNLPVTKQDIFRPQENIMVASLILKELYDNYLRLGHREPDIWNYVLAAYCAGPASLKKGLKSYHWKYIEKVRQHCREFEAQIAA